MNMTQSTITYVCSAHSSDHELPDVEATIDSPSEVVGRALLFHGFGRKPDALDELVAVLVENNIEVVRPYLKSKARHGGLNDRDLMRAVACEFAAWSANELPVVVIGHSAGGAVAMVTAEQFLQETLTLTGVLLIDSNGKIDELMAPALAALQHKSVPVRTIAASAGRCNRQAQIDHRSTLRRGGQQSGCDVSVALWRCGRPDECGHRLSPNCRLVTRLAHA
jgi:alpha-beta hydrolase superfamily lysophospholipase